MAIFDHHIYFYSLVHHVSAVTSSLGKDYGLLARIQLKVTPVDTGDMGTQKLQCDSKAGGSSFPYLLRPASLRSHLPVPLKVNCQRGKNPAE